jgi:3-phenylpropionate/trans-cinnamate dioxygenase ferredoxin reductase component
MRKPGTREAHMSPAHSPGPIVIVGAGIGGLRTAEALRANGYAGKLIVIGAETHPPYSRPPLSKDLLCGRRSVEEILLRPMAALDPVEWRLGHPVVACSLSERSLLLANGDTLHFQGMAVAAGVRPRRLDLPGPVAGRHVLRQLDDALALRPLLGPGVRLVVIGAGFIGCEVAASARGLGCDVTVVAPEDVPMQRPLGLELGRALQRRHERHAVRFRMGTGVVSLRGDDHVAGVEIGTGEILPCDVLIEAVGSIPNVEWLDENGLDLTDGLVCDEHMRVEGRPEVVAVGDLARFPNALFGGTSQRVEHWNMPTETARRAAPALLAALSGSEPPRSPFAPMPVFWTHQFEVRLQSFGDPGLGAADVRLLEGDFEDGPVVVGYYRDARLVGIVGTGGPKQLLPYRAQLLNESDTHVGLA